MKNIYSFKFKPNCSLGFNTPVTGYYYQENFPDGNIKLSPYFECGNQNGSSDCRNCISRYLVVAKRADLTPDVLGQLFG